MLMRQLFAIASILFLAGVCHASLVASNLFTLANLNRSTNTGPAVFLGYLYAPNTTFNIQTVGTGGTNGAGGYIYAGLTTNFASMTPIAYYAASNDTIYPLTLTNNGALPLYVTFQAFNTTNMGIQIGAQSIQQN